MALVVGLHFQFAQNKFRVWAIPNRAPQVKRLRKNAMHLYRTQHVPTVTKLMYRLHVVTHTNSWGMIYRLDGVVHCRCPSPIKRVVCHACYVVRVHRKFCSVWLLFWGARDFKQMPNSSWEMKTTRHDERNPVGACHNRGTSTFWRSIFWTTRGSLTQSRGNVCRSYFSIWISVYLQTMGLAIRVHFQFIRNMLQG